MAQIKNDFEHFDTSFEQCPLEHQLIYPSLFSKKLPCITNLLQINYLYPIQKFYLDKDQQLIGYLYKEQDNNMWLAIYSIPQNTFLLEYEIARYNSLEYTMEEKRNCMITDLNNDGILDIAIINELHDLEPTIEDTENGILHNNQYKSTHFFYLFKNGKYEYTVWDDQLLKKFKLKP